MTLPVGRTLVKWPGADRVSGRRIYGRVVHRGLAFLRGGGLFLANRPKERRRRVLGRRRQRQRERGEQKMLGDPMEKERGAERRVGSDRAEGGRRAEIAQEFVEETAQSYTGERRWNPGPPGETCREEPDPPRQSRNPAEGRSNQRGELLREQCGRHGDDREQLVLEDPMVPDRRRRG